MTAPVTVRVRGLTKRHGRRTVVDDVSFDLTPGTVTGLVGPNGAGKSSVLRLLLGLDRPTAGTATFDGRAYADLDAPLRVVGAALDPRWFHPGRRAVDHLRWLAVSQGIRAGRVDEVLTAVGLAAAARDRVRSYSLGMTQRLAVAVALLGDPAVVVLDEPLNGLDPEGMAWMRRCTASLAAEGRTVVVSSHLMAELERSADRLLVMSHGRVVADDTVGGFRGHHPDLETAFVAATSGAYAAVALVSAAVAVRRPLAAEWVKARTLRSTPWTLGVTLLLSAGLNVLASLVSASQWDGDPGFDLVGVMLQPGAAVGQLGVLVVAALVVTGEYGGGTIAPTLLGLPRRTPVLVAKAVLVTIVGLVLGLVAAGVSYAVGATAWAGKLPVGLGDHQLWRVVTGFPLVLAVTAVFSLGVGTLVRHTAAALATVTALVVVLPSVVGALPGRAAQWVATLMPGGWSFHSVMLARADHELLGPWVGFAVSVGWALVALGLGALSLRHRDA